MTNPNARDVAFEYGRECFIEGTVDLIEAQKAAADRFGDQPVLVKDFMAGWEQESFDSLNKDS